MIDKIFNEDCLEGMKRIPNGIVDFVLTDLPFGITACDWDSKLDLQVFWREVKRVLKPQSCAAMFASGRFSYELIRSNYDWFKYKWVWVKNRSTNFVHAKNRPMSKFEEILIFSNGVVNHESLSPNTRMKYFPQGVHECSPRVRTDSKQTVTQLRGTRDAVKKAEGLTRFNAKNKFGGTYGERPSHVNMYTSTKTGYPADVLYFDVVHNVGRLNATQKPVPLLEYLMKTYTNEGELVLDATIGSGSTAVAAINTGRHFIGFETEKKFFDIANERIAKAYEEQGLFKQNLPSTGDKADNQNVGE